MTISPSLFLALLGLAVGVGALLLYLNQVSSFRDIFKKHKVKMSLKDAARHRSVSIRVGLRDMEKEAIKALMSEKITKDYFGNGRYEAFKVLETYGGGDYCLENRDHKREISWTSKMIDQFDLWDLAQAAYPKLYGREYNSLHPIIKRESNEEKGVRK